MKVKKTDPTLFVDPYGEAKQKLLNRGYVAIPVTKNHNWSGIHEWCKQYLHFDYTWFGLEFWFADKQDAVLFQLRWA